MNVVYTDRFKFALANAFEAGSDRFGEATAERTYRRIISHIEEFISEYPRTGRWHQIRRHMNRVSHPIIGDREHGDGRHNVFFRDQLKIDGLCLWAKELTLRHPVTGEKITFKSPESEKWTAIKTLFVTP